MKVLLLSITLVCVSNTLAAQHDKAEKAVNSSDKPQMDEPKADAAKTEEPAGLTNSIQPERTLTAPLQNTYAQPRTNYPSQNYYNQPYYPSQSYNQYQYQQPAWNAPAMPAARPLLGNKYWEYPNLRARVQNRYWNNQPQQPNYYGRNQQWNYQNQWNPTPFVGQKPAPVPQTIDPFDSTSEKYYQSEYNYGSVQPTNTGIELMPSEFEKGPGGQTTRLSRARAWHNYHTGKPAWEMQQPIIQPRVYKPPPQPKPQVIQPLPNQGLNMQKWGAARTLCYQNCRRRCGFQNWNGSGLGCKAVSQRQNYNGQYWGAASSWNNVPNTQPVSQDITVNNPTTIAPASNSEDKPCQWKWVDNDWKWICSDNGPEEDAPENEEGSAMDA